MPAFSDWAGGAGIVRGGPPAGNIPNKIAVSGRGTAGRRGLPELLDRALLGD